MLNFLRTKTKSWVVRGFFLVLALSFGLFWGIQDVFQDLMGSQTLAKVGPHRISTEEFQNHLHWEVQQIALLSGKPMPKEQLKDPEFLKDVLIQLIRNKLIELEAERIGLVIPDDHLRQMVHQSQLFQIRGLFSHQKFLEWARRQGLKEKQFINQLRQDLLRAYLVYGAVTPPFFISPAYTALYGHAFLEQRKASCVHIPYHRHIVNVQPDDKTLQAFMKNHEDRFMAPETRTGMVVFLDRSQSATSTASKDQAQEDFETLLLHVEKDLDQGATSQEIAQKHPSVNVVLFTSLDAQGHSSGHPVDASLSAQIIKKIFQGEVDQTSDLITVSKNRVALVRVQEIQSTQPLSFKDARPLVLAAWIKQEQVKHTETFAKDIQKDPRQFRKMAEKHHLSLYNIMRYHPVGIELGLTEERRDMELKGRGVSPKRLSRVLFETPLHHVAITEGTQGYEACYVQSLEGPSSWPPEKQVKLENWFKHQNTQDLMEGYMAHLAKTYKVKIYPHAYAMMPPLSQD